MKTLKCEKTEILLCAAVGTAGSQHGFFSEGKKSITA